MAPITQDIVDGLKDQIGRLESKVADLEGRLGGQKPQTLAEQMRIILMGPPGAGAFMQDENELFDIDWTRQGHSGASTQG